jgi:hypothetical protein
MCICLESGVGVFCLGRAPAVCQRLVSLVVARPASGLQQVHTKRFSVGGGVWGLLGAGSRLSASARKTMLAGARQWRFAVNVFVDSWNARARDTGFVRGARASSARDLRCARVARCLLQNIEPQRDVIPAKLVPVMLHVHQVNTLI